MTLSFKIMTNRKKIISTYFFILLFVISIFLIVIHTNSSINIDYNKYSEDFYNNLSAINKLIESNNFLRNDIFILINDNENFHSTDSILKKIHHYSLSMDSALNQLQILEKTELQNIKKDLDLHYKNILNLYYNDKKQEAKIQYIKKFNPISLSFTQLCYVYSNREIKLQSHNLKSIEKNKRNIMLYSIIIIILLTIGFFIFLKIYSQTEKNYFEKIYTIDNLQKTNSLYIKLIESENKLNNVFASAGIGVLIINLSENHVFANVKATQILDINTFKHEIPGVKNFVYDLNEIKNFFPLEKILKNYYITKNYDSVINFEILHPVKGKLIIESFSTIISDENSQEVKEIYSIVRDITEEKKNKELKEKYYNFIKSISSINKLGYWTWDSSKPKPDVSDEWLEIFGIERDVYENSTVDHLISYWDKESLQLVVKRMEMMKKAQISEFFDEYTFNHPVKGKMYIEVFGKIVDYTPQGKAIYHGYHKNISEFKKLKSDLEFISKERKFITENFPLPLLIAEKRDSNNKQDYYFVVINSEFESLTNINRFAILNKPLEEITEISFQKDILNEIETLQKNKNLQFDVFDKKLKKHLQVFVFMLNDDRFAVIFTDISENKKLFEYYKNCESLSKYFTNYSENAILLIKPETFKIIYSNSKAKELFNATNDDDFKNLEFIKIQSDNLQKEKLISFFIKQASSNFKKIENIPLDWEFRRFDGSKFQGQIKLNKIIYNNSEVIIAEISDITEFSETVKKYERFQQWLQKIINSIPSLLVVKDNFGNILMANDIYLETFGQTAETIVGKNNKEIYHPSDANIIQQIDNEVSQFGIPRTYEQKLFISTGEQRYFLVNKVPLKDENNKVYAIVSHGTDITQLKNLEEKLRTLKDEAVSANRAKSVFLANMSHEIRTPLNSIIGFSEILANNTADPVVKNHAYSILTAGKALLNLITDVLDLAKIESGKINLNPDFHDLNKILDEINSIFKIRAEEKGLNFKIVSNIKQGLVVNIDGHKIRQVLLNLVGNAIKFTEKGFVEVSLKHNLKENSLADIEIKINDSGPGISESDLNKIFLPFEQAGNIDNQKFGGTGLGLSICDRIIKLMNGNISVESKLNYGTTFTVSIPNLEYELTNNIYPKESKKVLQVIFDKAKILITDDVKDSRDILTEHLKIYNFGIYEAVSGNHALQLAKQVKPDIFILDIRLPDISGIDVAKAVKEDISPKTKIIAYTVAIDKILVEEKINEYFDGYITKPVIKSALIKELKKFIPYKEISSSKPEENKSLSFNNITKNIIKDFLGKNKISEPSDFTKKLLNSLISEIKNSFISHKDEDSEKLIDSLEKAMQEFNVEVIDYFKNLFINIKNEEI